MDAAFLSGQIQTVVERELSNSERALKYGNHRRALSELEVARRKLVNIALHLQTVEAGTVAKS